MTCPPLDATFLHVSLAARIMGEIENGLWQPGQRLPSVREMSRRCATSVTTVLAAYRALEDRQAIESRPQKGFYVRTPSSPNVAARAGLSTTDDAESSQALASSLNDTQRMASFGTAICESNLFPVNALTRRIASVARRHGELLTEVSFSAGSERLRDNLAAHAQGWNCALGANDILLTNGCIEAFGLCLQAVARAGDVIVVESPAFYGFLSTIAQLGMLAVPVAFHADPALALAEVERLAGKRRIGACLLSTNVSNPNGASMTNEVKGTLVAVLERLRIPLIEDATFSDLHFDGTQRAAMSYDRSGNVLLCSSLTKTLAPGLRVGWVSGGRYHPRLVALKRTLSAGQPLLIQEAIGDYLAAGGYRHHLRQLRSRCRQHVSEALAWLEHLFGTDVHADMPSGGYLLWLRLPAGVSAMAVHRRALEQGITVAPGAHFSPAGAFDDHLRLNCGFPMTDDRRAALTTLSRIVRALQ